MVDLPKTGNADACMLLEDGFQMRGASSWGGKLGSRGRQNRQHGIMVGDLLLDNSRIDNPKAGRIIDVINPGVNWDVGEIPEGAAEIAPWPLQEHIIKIL